MKKDRKEYYKEYANKPKVKAKRKEYFKEYYKRPEVVERKNAYQRNWTKNNPEKAKNSWSKNNLKRREQMKEWYQIPEVKEKILKSQRERYKDPERKYYVYQNNCKRKNREILPKEKFFEEIKKPCYYCGSVENIGLDRIDSLRGYVEGNYVPCCSKCNLMKMDLPYEEFLSQTQKIVKHLNLGGKE